jgi:riboflavin biosynthesis pyrimidine reductase
VARRTPASPLELLFEAANLPELALPAALTAGYGGKLGFNPPCVLANFVASVDGIVELPGGAESGGVVSMNHENDRFVMGLLRACSDAVLIGAGTFRQTPKACWYPESIYRPADELFVELRQRLGLAPRPKLVLVTGSGDIDVALPAVADALIVTTRAGEARLGSTLPPTARLWAFDTPHIVMQDLIGRLHAEGARTVLCEGGPSLVAQLIAEKVLDELFLTVSPVLFGRLKDDGRKALTHGVDLSRVTLDLLSARRSGSHLLLRYRLDR